MATPTAPTVIVLGRNEIGTVAESDGFRYYLTDCCGASAKGCEDGTACRLCYHLIDDALGGIPPQRDGYNLHGMRADGPLTEVYGDGIAYDVWAATRLGA